MRVRTQNDGSMTIWASPSDTYHWANRIGAYWPCSYLSGKRLRADLAANGDLVGLTINGSDSDCPADELTAFINDAKKEAKFRESRHHA